MEKVEPFKQTTGYDHSQDIEYSSKYNDDVYEYRHVILPITIANQLPDPLRLLSESEWRELGVSQSSGWVHYSIHHPEPHILLFRRPLTPTPVPVPVQKPVILHKPLTYKPGQFLPVAHKPITILPPFQKPITILPPLQKPNLSFPHVVPVKT